MVLLTVALLPLAGAVSSVAAADDMPFDRSSADRGAVRDRSSVAASDDLAEALGGPPFPRLAMWNPIFDSNTVAECARFDALVGIFYYDLFWDARLGKFSKALYGANPKIKLFTYYTAVETWPGVNWWGPLRHNPYLPDWPDGWFVTEAGTTLAATVDAEQTTIVVTDWQREGPIRGTQQTPWDIFRVGVDVQCDGEIMKVLALDEKTRTLTVERNLHDRLGRGMRHGISHAAGSRIAPLVGFWPTTYTMDITLNGRRAELHGATEPELYSEYHLRMSRTGAADYFWDLSADKDGIMWDRMEDWISWRMWTATNSIDLNRDNVPDSFEEMDETWFDGIRYIEQMFHETYPGYPIARNKSRSLRFSDFNGENFESWPQYAWDEWDIERTRGKTKYWHQFFFGDERQEIGGIVDSAQQSASPNFTMLQCSDDELNMHPERYVHYVSMDYPNFVPDYRKMRWALASALVAGVYFGYEINSEAHGLPGLLWFDEYDDAGNQRGYLGFPLREMEKLHTDKMSSKYGAWGREYAYGYVIVNPLDYDVEVRLPEGLWRRIEGKQVPEVNDGRIEQGSVTVPSYDGLILKRVQQSEMPATSSD